METISSKLNITTVLDISKRFLHAVYNIFTHSIFIFRILIINQTIQYIINCVHASFFKLFLCIILTAKFSKNSNQFFKQFLMIIFSVLISR